MTNIVKKRTGRNPTKTWSCGLYLRLSRDDGDARESDSISSQREILMDFVSKNSDLCVYDTYIDDGWSGTTFNRPRFKEMEEDLRAKKIDCIIVKDLSRFGRNSIEIGNYLTILFPYLKTRFICVNDNVDSYLEPDSLDNLSTKFKNLINDEYCRDISIKVKSTLTMMRQCGEYIGSFPCYGYMKDPNNCHKIIIDPETAPIVRRIGLMFLAGESMRGIVRTFNGEGILAPAIYKKMKYPKYNPNGVTERTVWSDRTIRRILTNRMYVGDMVQNVMNTISYRIQKCRPVNKENYIIVENTHEPIFTRDEFKRISELLLRDTRESPVEQKLGVLSGFIKCGDCKRGMLKRRVNGGNKYYVYYICSTYKNRGKNLCTKHTILADKVEKTVLEVINLNATLALEIEPILTLINESPMRIKASMRLKEACEKQKQELKKYERLREELYPDYKAGLIDSREYEIFRRRYVEKIEGINEKIETLENKIQEIERGVSPENEFIKEFKKHQGKITELTREIVSTLVENVFVYEGGRIEVVLKYRDAYDTLVEYLSNNRVIVAKSALGPNIQKMISR